MTSISSANHARENLSLSLLRFQSPKDVWVQGEAPWLEAASSQCGGSMLGRMLAVFKAEEVPGCQGLRKDPLRTLSLSTKGAGMRQKGERSTSRWKKIAEGAWQEDGHQSSDHPCAREEGTTSGCISHAIACMSL